jgi:hypothetical protein
MAVLAALAATLIAPADGGAPMTIAQPLLFGALVLLKLPVVLTPAAILPIEVLEKRLTLQYGLEVAARVAGPAAIIATAEVFILAWIDDAGRVDFTLEVILALGMLPTLMLLVQLLMLLSRNREQPPNKSLERTRER